MKIGYKNKYLNINLILGVVWLIWYFVRIFRIEEPGWTDYGWIFMSLIYFGVYFYQRKYNYLTIEHGIINVNGPFGKKLNLTEIKHIKKFAGDYILKTDHKELTIHTQVIEPNLLAELNTELEKLNLTWN